MTSTQLRSALVFTFAVALALGGTATAQSAPPPGPPDQLRTLSREELDIVKVLTRQEDAWNHGDLAAFATGYKNSPDIVFIGRHISRGYDDMVSSYKQSYPNRDAMGNLSFSDLEPHILDEHFAFVIGHYHLDRARKAGGNADGIFSLIFEKTPEGWKIIADHTTS